MTGRDFITLRSNLREMRAGRDHLVVAKPSLLGVINPKAMLLARRQRNRLLVRGDFACANDFRFHFVLVGGPGRTP